MSLIRFVNHFYLHFALEFCAVHKLIRINVYCKSHKMHRVWIIQRTSIVGNIMLLSNSQIFSIQVHFNTQDLWNKIVFVVSTKHTNTVHTYSLYSYILYSQGRSQRWGRGGAAAPLPEPPTRDSCPPPTNFYRINNRRTA